MCGQAATSTQIGQRDTHAAIAAIARALTAIALALGLAACTTVSGWFSSDAYLIPDDEGLYAVNGETLQRLDGNPEWEAASWPTRSGLGTDTRFVVYQSALRNEKSPPAADAIKLHKVAWVRSKIGADGSIGPVTDNRWGTPELQDFEVPLAFRAVDARPDIQLATPTRPLAPGLYTLRFRTPANQINARAGILWSSVNQEKYSANTCVDRYPDGSYRTCDDQPRALSANGLSLYLLSPESKTEPDGATISVRGVVVNNSDKQRRIPTLEGMLRTADGRVVQRWRFDSDIAELPPGESAGFHSVVRNPPTQAHEVYVRFSP